MREYFDKLRAANNARHAVWPGAGKGNMEFSAIEFAGEAGEAVEAFEDYILGVERNGLMPRQAVMEEIGDVFVTIDLLARDLDITLTGKQIGLALQTTVQYAETDRQYIMQFAGCTGKVMDGIKKFIREQRGIAGNGVGNLDTRRAFVADKLESCMVLITLAARGLGLTPFHCVPMKFNKTSRKVAVPLFMDADWSYQANDPLDIHA